MTEKTGPVSTEGPETIHEKDAVALRRFLARDISGFEEIVTRHQDRIFRFSLALTGSEEDARDACQEVFLRAVHTLRQWRFESRLTTWLFRLTLNVCREIRRKRESESSKRDRWLRLVAPLLPRQSRPPSEKASGSLDLLVDSLPPRQREVVVLRVFHDLSVSETALVLDVREGTVKSHFFKAMKSLRSRLEHKTQERSSGGKNDSETLPRRNPA